MLSSSGNPPEKISLVSSGLSEPMRLSVWNFPVSFGNSDSNVTHGFVASPALFQDKDQRTANRPADIDTCGSGGAGVWAGPPKHARSAVARACGVGRARLGARTHIIYDLLFFFIGRGSYMISRYAER